MGRITQPLDDQRLLMRRPCQRDITRAPDPEEDRIPHRRRACCRELGAVLDGSCGCHCRVRSGPGRILRRPRSGVRRARQRKRGGVHGMHRGSRRNVRSVHDRNRSPASRAGCGCGPLSCALFHRPRARCRRCRRRRRPRLDCTRRCVRRALCSVRSPLCGPLGGTFGFGYLVRGSHRNGCDQGRQLRRVILKHGPQGGVGGGRWWVVGRKVGTGWRW